VGRKGERRAGDTGAGIVLPGMLVMRGTSLPWEESILRRVVIVTSTMGWICVGWGDAMLEVVFGRCEGILVSFGGLETQQPASFG